MDTIHKAICPFLDNNARNFGILKLSRGFMEYLRDTDVKIRLLLHVDLRKQVCSARLIINIARFLCKSRISNFLTTEISTTTMYNENFYV